ncbi:hypothetical protein ACQY0O_000087 [Thecaphora frezii]
MPPKVTRPSHPGIGEPSPAARPRPQPQPPSRPAAGRKTSRTTSPRRNNPQQPRSAATSHGAEAGFPASDVMLPFESAEPVESTEAATAALIDLAVAHCAPFDTAGGCHHALRLVATFVDQWHRKQRQIASTFERQVNDYLRAVEEACLRTGRQAEQRW